MHWIVGDAPPDVPHVAMGGNGPSGASAPTGADKDANPVGNAVPGVPQHDGNRGVRNAEDGVPYRMVELFVSFFPAR